MARAKKSKQDDTFVPSGAADVQVDTSKDVHWDANNRSPEEKAKDSGNAPEPKPYGNAPDAGLTPEESDKKFSQTKEQVTPMNGEDNES